MLDLYKNIRILRKQNGWTQDELAKRMGYTDRSSIAKIEQGKFDLARSKIFEFAKIFGVTPSELMGDDGIDLPHDTPEAKQIRDAYANDSLSSEDRELLDLYHIASPEVKTLVDFALRGLKHNP